MVKVDLTSRQFIVYFTIAVFIAIIFIGLSWLLVDKLKWFSGFTFSLIFIPVTGLLRYILLLIYWKKRRK